jgi:pSer/pThr/pTyr-binding forkhead associated (FHA) protein
MEVILELSGHPKANVKQVLISDTVVVGRSQKCGLQIASAAVSRRHCEIRVGEDSVSVIDLGSSNGTFIDALRLAPGEETPLPSGARLNVGGVRFIVQYDVAGAPDAEAAPPPLAAIPEGDDLLLVEDEEAVPLTNQSNLVEEDELPSVSNPDDGEAGISFEEEPPLSASDFAAEADEPAVVEQTLSEDEPDLAEVEASAEAMPAAGSDEDFTVDAFDDEPDLEAMFSDEPAAASSDELKVAPADDEVPILEEDEDAAFSFLTDDDDSAQSKSSSKTEDSRLGDFLSQLGRD